MKTFQQELEEILVELHHSGFNAGLAAKPSKHLKDYDVAIEKAQAAITAAVERVIGDMHELSITDLELRQYQERVEIPVLSKTQLLDKLTSASTDEEQE